MRYRLDFSTGKSYYRTGMNQAISFAKFQLRKLYCYDHLSMPRVDIFVLTDRPFLLTSIENRNGVLCDLAYGYRL